VLSEAVSGARWKEQGARFVIDFALDLLADADVAGRALYFEMRVGTGEEVRFVDLWFEGTRYELKSVRELHEYLVTGRAGALGQFQRDVTRLLGQSEETAFDNLARLKWVFDGRRLPPDVDEAFILAQLGDWLAANEPYRSWPRLSELLDALKGVVVVWP